MLSMAGERGWGGFKVTYLKSLYLFAPAKGAGDWGYGGVGVARQAHPACLHAGRPGGAFPRAPCSPVGEMWLEKWRHLKKKKKNGCVKSVFQHERTINSLVKWLLHKRKSCFVVQWNYSIHCIDLCCSEAASWRLPAPLLTASLNMIFMGVSVVLFFFFNQSVCIITQKGSLWVSFSRDSWGAQEERVRVW